MSDTFKNLAFQTVHCPVVGQVDVVFGQYVSNKRVSISIRDHVTGEPIMTATNNHSDMPCTEEQVWIKEYSENLGVTRWLILRGVIEEQPTAGFQGYHGVWHWQYKLTQQSLAAINATKGVQA